MKDRKIKIIAIIALCAGIVGLSIGFAAFSNILTISSSANVTPDSSTFSVEFSDVSCKEVGNATIVSNAKASGTTISGLNVQLKGPGDEVNCTATVKNTGKYIAYLTSITSGKISCTKGSSANETLVNAACNSITMPVSITGTKSFSETITTTHELSYSSYSGHSLAINGTDTVNFSIKYSGNNRADGEFTINVPSITLIYKSLDESGTEIQPEPETPEIVQPDSGTTETTLASCDFQTGTPKTIGAKYSCDFGGGYRDFYILELGSNPVTNTKLKSDEVALILEGNYDTTTQAWCASGNNNSCNADGLTSKLDEIAGSWSKLKSDQIGLPTVEQIMVADGKSENAYKNYPTLANSWLYNWTNDTWGDVVYGYWTSTSQLTNSAWYIDCYGNVENSAVDYSKGFGVRPIVILKI